MKYKATNIQWDVSFDDDILPRLKEMTIADVADAVSCPLDEYKSMTEEGREDYAEKFFYKNPDQVIDYIGLPSEAMLPQEIDIDDDEAVADYLSETYGFCMWMYDIEKVA